MIYPAGAFLISFIITVIAAKIFIPVLKSVKMGQKILDIGPRWHKSKEGTPIMGGLFFIAGSTAAICLICALSGGFELRIIATLAMCLCYGLIGLLDDYTKFFKKRNKGLTANQKLLLQFFVGILYLLILHFDGGLSTSVTLPFTSLTFELGVLYYALALLGLVFTVNSVNLTDGIDGLSSSVTLIVSLFFTVVLWQSGDMPSSFAAAIMGGCAGFLVYNFHPARVFMGDTGSLYLGGAVAGMAFLADMPIILIFVGIIYYIESLSVMIQVASFKLTGKRVFKMSPIHHHFEMSGWGEIKIVAVASLITAVGCVSAFISIILG
ncbi:MAG: phospho-N-acetylmuramoyl-pentapeptide-transferase [Eubacteriales bacterium]